MRTKSLYDVSFFLLLIGSDVCFSLMPLLSTFRCRKKMKRKWKMEAQRHAGNTIPAFQTPHSHPAPRCPSHNLFQSQSILTTDTLPAQQSSHDPPKRPGIEVRSSSPTENHAYIAPPPPPKSMRLSPPRAAPDAFKDEDEVALES
jgi:hypothetical protein